MLHGEITEDFDICYDNFLGSRLCCLALWLKKKKKIGHSSKQLFLYWNTLKIISKQLLSKVFPSSNIGANSGFFCLGALLRGEKMNKSKQMHLHCFLLVFNVLNIFLYRKDSG